MKTTCAHRLNQLLIGCGLAALSLASSAMAQCTGQAWQTMGTVPGVHGPVYSMVEWDPDGAGPQPSLLVIGGEIQAAGPRLVNNIATWDGADWSTLGNGLPQASPDQDATVVSLAVREGQLWACGYGFAGSDGQALGPVVQWTGTQWQSVGQLEGSAGAMVEFNGGIAAAVSHYDGTSWIPQVVWWDGAAWQTLGTFASDNPQYDMVYTLAVDDGLLVVGGSFSSVDGIPSNGLARWTGAAWEDLGLDPGSWAVAVAVNGPDMVVTDLNGPSPVARLLRRDGSGWTELPGPYDPPYPSYANLQAVGGDIYTTDDGAGIGRVGGIRPAVFRLVGSDWQPLGSNMYGVMTLAQFRGGLIAGGSMNSSEDRGLQGIAAWNGISWNTLAHGLSSVGVGPLVKVIDGQIYAANLLSDDQEGSAIMRWNGHGWDRVLNATTLRLESYQDDLILSSSSGTSGLLRYNGSALEEIGPSSPYPCTPYVLDNRIYAITNQYFPPIKILRLDADGWTQLGPDLDNPPTSLDVVDGELYALGLKDAELGLNNVGRWDGSTWVPVGTWPTQISPLFISNVFRFNGRLIAAGQFWSYNTAFAVLNGDQWEVWPSPFYGARVSVVGNEIVGIAWTSSIEETLAVAFDGTSWRTLGTSSGIGGGAYDFQACGDGIVIVGGFVSINGQCSNMFARLPSIHCCGSADFNGDGDAGTDQDIQAFFACLAGNCCPACGSVDFNSDGDVGTDQDIEAFFRVLAGGSC